MNTIDLTKLSKEELIKMWETANASSIVETTVKSNYEKFDEYVKWLENNNFGSDLLNDLAQEIASTMNYAYRYGMTKYEYDPELDYDVEVTIPVDRENPNTKEVVLWCIEAISEDFEYLESYGISKKKPTKKLPYFYNDINWSIYKNENLF